MNNFNINTNSIYKNAPQSSEEEQVCYTILGQNDKLDSHGYPIISDPDNKHVFAKHINRQTGLSKYMIRLDSSGKLFNPVSIYGIEKEKTFLDRICRSNTKFKEVNQKVFNMYLKFLQSKNISWLNNAEREAE